MNHRRWLFVAFLCLIGIDITGGVLFSVVSSGISVDHGLYWAVVTATTVGYGDITPHTGQAYLVAVMVMLTAIPLYGIVLSFVTSLMTEMHVKHHLSGLHAKLDHAHAKIDHVMRHHDIPPLEEAHGRATEG